MNSRRQGYDHQWWNNILEGHDSWACWVHDWIAGVDELRNKSKGSDAASRSTEAQLSMYWTDGIWHLTSRVEFAASFENPSEFRRLINDPAWKQAAAEYIPCDSLRRWISGEQELSGGKWRRLMGYLAKSSDFVFQPLSEEQMDGNGPWVAGLASAAAQLDRISLSLETNRKGQRIPKLRLALPHALMIESLVNSRQLLLRHHELMSRHGFAVDPDYKDLLLILVELAETSLAEMGMGAIAWYSGQLNPEDIDCLHLEFHKRLVGFQYSWPMSRMLLSEHAPSTVRDTGRG